MSGVVLQPKSLELGFCLMDEPRKPTVVNKPTALTLIYLFLFLKFWARSEGCLNNVGTCQGRQTVSPTSSFLRKLLGKHLWDS